jgi:hypothetical protein
MAGPTACGTAGSAAGADSRAPGPCCCCCIGGAAGALAPRVYAGRAAPSVIPLASPSSDPRLSSSSSRHSTICGREHGHRHNGQATVTSVATKHAAVRFQRQDYPHPHQPIPTNTNLHPPTHIQTSSQRADPPTQPASGRTHPASHTGTHLHTPSQ